MKQKTTVATILTVLSLRLLLAIAEPDLPAPEVINTITAADLKSNLYFLASNEMRGRDINTPFNEIAAEYLAHRFQLMGLEPANDGSYYQYFSVVQTQLADSNRLEIRYPGSPVAVTGVLREDFYPSALSAGGRVAAPLVLAGYGITAPELGYNDYEGIDVRGAVAVILTHEPGENDPHSPFDGVLDSNYSAEYYKIRNAQTHGAAAVIFVVDESNHPERKTLSRSAARIWPEEVSVAPYYLEIWTDEIQIPAVYLSPEKAGTLFEKTLNTSVEALQQQIDSKYRPQSARLPGVEAMIETALLRNPLRLRNVLAYLPGSDPTVRNEVIIIGAHFDHVGVRDGNVYNGADDDASGTAGLLEVAEAYASSSRKPKRSVLFAGWNAEERGLLGSQYYVERPILPLKSALAVFQMDMIGRNEEVTDPADPRFRGLERQSAEENRNSVNILGYSRSRHLHDLVVRNNQYIGLQLRFRYDNNPSNLLRRSDNWPFLVKGVPALFFHTGLHPDYHQPTDTPDKINYPKMEKIVRLVFLCSWSAANTTDPPRLDSPHRQ